MSRYFMKRETRNTNALRPLPLPTLHSQRILKKVPVLPELAEGSQDLADAVVQAFSDTDVKGILMCTHGLIAVGSTMREAEYTAELMEESVNIAWKTQLIS